MGQLKNIYFPGVSSAPSSAQYGIFLSPEKSFPVANIVVVQSDRQNDYMGTSLYNTDEGRNIVLNRILENDLRGIRLDYINFYVILDLSTTLEGMKLPIHLDFDDYIAKENPYNCTPSDTTTGRILQWITGEKTYSYWSGHVLGGCARFYTELDDQNREPLSVDSARELLNRVGYKIPTKE
ncbi:hypothetical protein ACVSK9_19795 [Pseudomonas aeruginosa]|uniref:hypothetical protein n=1 Tax=Pseudomonas TaxID=286 RepID=UPI000F7F1C83|nr:hypothetical protein [Pseudomonas aeruginosa]RTA96124.1 hypothetical protein EJ607_03550 [Pseudomonas aeruginosa]UJF43081.1 hypothetical protein JKV45_32965 [Pseudomonas aeruginosa]WOT78639.1 hypothetical protein R5026_33120 [Pseudomonas aeruginosa]WOT91585.1 hypothetical protein R5020_33315 [Pseudomonas aeruginosa]WOU04451.1 hypothetical protein R5015_33545 [Pseudomonas aeruginosa]